MTSRRVTTPFNEKGSSSQFYSHNCVLNIWRVKAKECCHNNTVNYNRRAVDSPTGR